MSRNRFKKVEEYKNDWLDWWLSDEPPPEAIQSKMYERQLKTVMQDDKEYQNSETIPIDYSGATYVTVNLNVPNVKLPNLKEINIQKLEVLRKSRRVLFSTYALTMMAAGVLTHSLLINTLSTVPKSDSQPHSVLAANYSSNVPVSENVTSPSNLLSKPSATTSNLSALSTNNSTPSEKAPFVPVAPVSKPELGNYAFAKTSYDSSSGAYTYIDVLQGGLISVTQQLVPKIYPSGQEAIAKITASIIGAKEQITTSAGNTYIYTDSKTHKQTVVLSMQGLIISINSNSTYSNGSWIEYINNLH